MKLFKKKMTPDEFHALCIKKTHELAMEHGFVKGGTKFVPELLPLCNWLVHSDLNCEAITSQFHDNVDLLEAICNRCMMYGIILADTWHRDFSYLQIKAQIIEADGPNGYIQPLVEDVLEFTPSQFKQWMEAVFLTCLTELGSIRNSGEEYTRKLFPTCFQVGVSMMLSHYGL